MAEPRGRLLGKVAVVTGASSGLGRAIALAFAREDAAIICADLQASARMAVSDEQSITTHDLITKEGGKGLFVQTDVGDGKQMEELVATAVNQFGRLDMFVSSNTF